MFKFVDKVDHVLAHRGAVDPVNVLSSLHTGVFRLQHTQERQKYLNNNASAVSHKGLWKQSISTNSYLNLLYNLFAKRADFGWNGDGHVLDAAVLTADAVKRTWTIQHPATVQVSLQRAEYGHNNQNMSWKSL